MASVLEALSTVDWTEPWLLTVMSCHVAVTGVILFTKRFMYFQALILVVLGLLCLATERLNEWAAANYKMFSKEQYFDADGFFLSIVYSLPLIANSTFIVILWFCHVWQLMKEVAITKARRMAQLKKENGIEDKKSK